MASVPEALDANANTVLTMAEQRDLEKRHQQDQKEIKALKQDLRRKEKAFGRGKRPRRQGFLQTPRGHTTQAPRPSSAVHQAKAP
ncbi:MAG: hypothetical protein EBZ96_11165 [Synechococcaceae bacterium WB9_3_282]|nr:hypothetical protein [Synechococcaceae bacterium WB9_3_282]